MQLAGVDDVVGVNVDGVTAGTGASASAAFTIARPDVVLIKHLWLESRVDYCGDAQLFVVSLFQLGLYTVDILAAKKIEIEIQTSIFATKIDKNRSFIL